MNKFYSGFAVAKAGNKFGIILFQSLLIWALNALIMFIPFFAFAPIVECRLGFWCFCGSFSHFYDCLGFACTRCDGNISLVFTGRDDKTIRY